MRKELPRSADLSKGRRPEDFFVPLIPDRFAIEEWRADPNCFDYTIPHNSWCATTTLRMALLLEGMPAPTQEELFEDACRFGVYQWKNGKGWDGAYHVPFASFLRRHGFTGRFIRNVTPDGLAGLLARDLYCMPRVHAAIRFADRIGPEKKIGHVVFCFGYDTQDGGREFRIHNCGGFASLNSQMDFRVSEARLKQVFSGDVTIFRKRKR